MDDIKFIEGGMGEYSDWEIHYDEPAYYRRCRHCYEDNHGFWVCPKVVYSQNEGGYNSTKVCLDCILEAAKELNGRR